jgi:hypothetical protein
LAPTEEEEKKKRAAFVRVGRFSFFGRLVVGVVYLTCLPE